MSIVEAPIKFELVSEYGRKVVTINGPGVVAFLDLNENGGPGLLEHMIMKQVNEDLFLSTEVSYRSETCDLVIHTKIEKSDFELLRTVFQKLHQEFDRAFRRSYRVSDRHMNEYERETGTLESIKKRVTMKIAFSKHGSDAKYIDLSLQFTGVRSFTREVQKVFDILTTVLSLSREELKFDMKSGYSDAMSFGEVIYSNQIPQLKSRDSA